MHQSKLNAMKSHPCIIQMFAIILLCFLDRNVQAQLVVTNSTNYVQLVDSFMLSGIGVSNINYTGNAFTNQFGQFVHVAIVRDNQTQIAIKNLQSGIYCLTFKTEKYFVTSQLIVQQ